MLVSTLSVLVQCPCESAFPCGQNAVGSSARAYGSGAESATLGKQNLSYYILEMPTTHQNHFKLDTVLSSIPSITLANFEERSMNGCREKPGTHTHTQIFLNLYYETKEQEQGKACGVAIYLLSPSKYAAKLYLIQQWRWMNNVDSHHT